MAKDTLTDDLIGTKDARIKVLQYQFDIRSSQLIESNTTISAHEKTIKKLKLKILAIQIASISAILGVIYILH